MAMPPTDFKPGTAPLDTLRLSQEAKLQLVAYVESLNHDVADNRRRLRVDFHGRKVFGRLSNSEGSGPLCSLVPRNLSVLGFAFVHGAFVNSGMRCRLTLPMLGNRWCEVEGTVRRCRHVKGVVHEVSVVFDEDLDLGEIVHLTPEQRRRLEAEALGGEAFAGDSMVGLAALKDATGPVLLVDPDALARTQLVAALEAAGFGVVAHASNHALREALQAEPAGAAPVAIVLAAADEGSARGGGGGGRPGVAELRFDPVALTSHLRRAGHAGTILLRVRAGTAPAAVQRLWRTAALSGVSALLTGNQSPRRLAAVVATHAAHAEAAAAGTPLRSVIGGSDDDAEERIAAFLARVPGIRERLRRPGASRQPETLAGVCQELLVEAGGAGFPAVADAARRCGPPWARAATTRRPATRSKRSSASTTGWPAWRRPPPPRTRTRRRAAASPEAGIRGPWVVSAEKRRGPRMLDVEPADHGANAAAASVAPRAGGPPIPARTPPSSAVGRRDPSRGSEGTGLRGRPAPHGPRERSPRAAAAGGAAPAPTPLRGRCRRSGS